MSVLKGGQADKLPELQKNIPEDIRDSQEITNFLQRAREVDIGEWIKGNFVSLLKLFPDDLDICHLAVQQNGSGA